MVYHCRVEYESAWSMPVEVRKWWVDRVNKEIKKQSNQGGPQGHTDPFGRSHD